MALVPAGIISPYAGTHASLPASGWSRKTALDSQYVRMAATAGAADLVTANGSASHGHTMAAHSHPFSGSTFTPASGYETTSPVTRAAVHSQASVSSGNSTITLNTTSNQLLHMPLIFVESDGTPTGFLASSVCMFRSDTLPGSWTRVGGNSFLMGQTTAGNGTVTTAGVSTHTHTQTAAHNHPNTNSGTSSGGSVNVGGSADIQHALTSHYHVVTFANTSVTFSTDTVEPEFRKINFIRNDTGGLDYPDKITAFWNGTHAAIPTDWARLTDYDGKFVKGCNADSEVGDVGGSLTHVHTQSHTHTGTNGVALNSSLATNTLAARRGVRSAEQTHNHPWVVTNNTTSTNANTSESAYPLHRKLILVEYTAPVVGGDTPLRSLMGVGL